MSATSLASRVALAPRARRGRASPPRSRLARGARVVVRAESTPSSDGDGDGDASSSSSPRAGLGRRALLAAGAAALGASPVGSALAFERPPPGYRPFNDTIDGYKLFRPDDWIEVKGSGNDVFFRNPANAEENMFVSISSPSSTKFDSVRDLGTPREAARKVLDQTLTEFMSTRIGVRRESEILSAEEREGVGVDGEPMLFYDVAFRVSSYATKNQYGLTEADRPQVLEWDRVLRSTLGVSNKRLYELRTQTSVEGDEEGAERVAKIVRDSFKPFEVDQSNLSFPLF